MFDVIGLGAAVYDTLLEIPSFPEEDTKMRASGLLFQGGGPCSTALAACAALGLRAAFIGAVGGDAAGAFLSDELARLGVDTAFLLRRPDCVSFHSYVLLHRAAATRTCVAYPGTAAPPQPDELPADFLRTARVLHLDGNHLDAAIAAARSDRDAGVTVCLDAGSLYPGIDALLPLVDWLIPSERFVCRFTGTDDAGEGARRLYDAFRPAALAVTQGERGGFLLTPDGIRRYPAFPVDAVDTNGAGDVFHGAYIAARLRGLGEYDAAVFASAASALKCTGMGARRHLPSFSAVTAFLRSRGVSLSS